MTNGNLAAASARASSPPRPNKNGSPPFNRTTFFPSRVFSTSNALICSCVSVCPGSFPGENELGHFRRPTQHFGITEIIVDNDFRALDTLLRAQRDEAEIARPGADEKTFSFSH